jgi:hypothetical protein
MRDNDNNYRDDINRMTMITWGTTMTTGDDNDYDIDNRDEMRHHPLLLRAAACRVDRRYCW